MYGCAILFNDTVCKSSMLQLVNVELLWWSVTSVLRPKFEHTIVIINHPKSHCTVHPRYTADLTCTLNASVHTVFLLSLFEVVVVLLMGFILMSCKWL